MKAILVCIVLLLCALALCEGAESPCDTCKIVVNRINDRVNHNLKKEELMTQVNQVMDSLCDLREDPMCYSILFFYKKEIKNGIVNGNTTTCQNLPLCTVKFDSSDFISSKVDPKPTTTNPLARLDKIKLKDIQDITCPICYFPVAVIFYVNAGILMETDKGLKKVCSMLPLEFKPACETVAKYYFEAWVVVEAAIDPKTFCPFIKACPPFH